MPWGYRVNGYSFTPDALKERPAHAASLGRIFTSWSLIEASVGTTLGDLMSAEPKAAIALLSTFRTNNSRVQAVKKVAKATLPASEYDPFQLLMKRVLSYAERRNEIAHGLWGVKEEDVANVYRLPLTALSDFALIAVSAYKSGAIAKVVGELEAQMRPFSLHDLEHIENDGEDLLGAVMKDRGERLAARHPQHVRRAST